MRSSLSSVVCSLVIAGVALGASNAMARPCSTMAMREAVKAGLPTAAMQERPTSMGYLDSERFPLRVHWEVAQFEARAPELLALLEEGWALLVEDQGWPAPMPDDGEGGDTRFDAYLGFVAPAAAITVAHEDVDDSDGRHASYSYIFLSGNLSEEELPVFAHHELAHAAQFAVDLRASFMFAEASAVAFERFALPDSDSWTDSLADFQGSPQAPLFANGIDWSPIVGEASFYEFGAAFFLLYLEQEHGDFDGALIRRLWEAGVQPDDVSDNEPDWLDAVAAEIAPPEDLLLDFATWRVLLGAWSIPGEGMPGADSLSNEFLPATRQLLPAVLDGTPLQLGLSELPHQLGCVLLETRALSMDMPIIVTARALTSPPRELGIAWLLGSPAEGRARRGVHGTQAPELTLRLTVPARETSIVAVCDVGERDADELPAGTDVELRIRRADIDLPSEDAGPPPDLDGGAAPDGGVPPTCGCQQVPSRSGGAQGPFAELRPYAMVAMVFVGLTIFGLRYARVRKRRRMYKDDGSRRTRDG